MDVPLRFTSAIDRPVSHPKKEMTVLTVLATLST